MSWKKIEEERHLASEACKVHFGFLDRVVGFEVIFIVLVLV